MTTKRLDPMPLINDLQLEQIDTLKPHPKNYRTHPEEQIDHLIASIEEHGIYRNVVVARDNTILAGHGVVEAARRMRLDLIPVRHLDVDPDDPRALKVLAGDNEIGQLAGVDDRALADILEQLSDDLVGTGFDDEALATLLAKLAPSELSMDTSEQLAGLEYRVVVDCRDEQHQAELLERFAAEDLPCRALIS